MRNFPDRYLNLHLSACVVNDGNRSAKDALAKWVEGGDNVWLFGPAGTGKTHLAAAAMNDGPIGDAVFYSVPKLLLGFQSSVKDHSELDSINALLKPKTTLLLDDIGAHRVSDFSIEMFGILMDEFYARNVRGLIFTSNLSPKQILETMGERIASRMQGIAVPIRVDGKDWRV